MATQTIELDSTQYVQVNTGLNPITLQVHSGVIRLVLSDAQPELGEEAHLVLLAKQQPFFIPSLATNVWARLISKTATLVTAEYPSATATSIVDTKGNALIEEQGNKTSLSVQDKDVVSSLEQIKILLKKIDFNISLIAG